jgi:hypothetical protein
MEILETAPPFCNPKKIGICDPEIKKKKKKKKKTND